MSEWRETTLGSVITLQRGFDLTEKSACPGPYPVISSGGYSYTHTQAKVRGPGVVTGRKGVLGKVHFSATDFWPHDTTLWVKDFQGSNPHFIYYLLQTLPLAALDAGASNPTLNRNHAHLLPVSVPTQPVQEVIAKILGSIDDLIENNRRRIEVLEEMAQAIYREWFVHFRFPGNQDANFVDSPLGPIPDGWEVSPFSDVATFTNGFAFKPAHFQTVGRPVVKIKELKQGVTSQTPRCPADQIKDKYWIEPGDLLFSWSADLGIYLWNDEPGLLNQHLFKVSPSGYLSVTMLRHMLQESLPGFRERAQGTTMKHIKRSALDEVVTVVPERHIVESAGQILDDYDLSVRKLSATKDRLTSIRDLLLPKLVTGEIDVSELDLNALLGAAG